MSLKIACDRIQVIENSFYSFVFFFGNEITLK